MCTVRVISKTITNSKSKANTKKWDKYTCKYKYKIKMIMRRMLLWMFALWCEVRVNNFRLFSVRQKLENIISIIPPIIIIIIITMKMKNLMICQTYVFEGSMVYFAFKARLKKNIEDGKYYWFDWVNNQTWECWKEMEIETIQFWIRK